jgi:translocation protein SEC62
MWLLGYEFWIFPRLFDESLSFQDSFKPVYTFEKGTAGQGYYRIGVVLMLVGFVYWACTQPTEFDGFIKAQKDFLDDIYNGNLLADVAQDHRDNLDRTKRVPNLEDLLREMEEDEKIRIAETAEKSSGASAAGSADEGADGAAKTVSEQIEQLVNSDGESYSQEEIDDKLLDDLLKDHDEQ